MADGYIGEVRMFAGNYAPTGWALCNGALMPTSENQALFSLLGTTYGGDGSTTFGLPDLRGRIPLSQGQGPGLTNRVAGETGGSESVMLLTSNLPAHAHTVLASQTAATATTAGPTVGFAAVADTTAGQTDARYLPAGKPVNGAPRVLNPAEVSPAGGSTPHDNVMPSLAINFIIAVNGIFPQQS